MGADSVRPEPPANRASRFDCRGNDIFARFSSAATLIPGLPLVATLILKGFRQPRDKR